MCFLDVSNHFLRRLKPSMCSSKGTMCVADCTSTLPLQSIVGGNLGISALPLNKDEVELKVEQQHRGS